ncbi:PREDICTED: uncharacterized protein LOC109588100 [Amphimedon queenslandica]|nr:PREDICTED: uncharacterized protein LOC109588100 [Amphimedon queenslandica]|eukprot:XP_019859850.1 PREDICTED: uncharacterized protein LOC109588100 [Amphimedon queenslandica]
MTAVTHSQDYTVRFPFVPGRFLVPEDRAPVPDTPAVNVTGLVAGISGNGCSRASSRKRICANVGMSVTIRCAVGPGDTYTITGPGESSNNAPLAFTVADNNYGDFTCTSTNPCGSVTDTIRLERADCPLPDVTVSVQRGDGTIVDSPCLRTDNDLFVSCADSLSGSTVAWYINGALMSNTGSRQRVTVSGNYTCVMTSTCGSVASTTFIKEAPTVAPGTGIIANPGSTQVPAGTRTCISRNGVGYSVRLVCNLSYNNESVSDVTFSWSTPGGGSQSGSAITASSIGDYTCTASNQCGSSQATTEVLGRIVLIKGGAHTLIEQTINIGSWLCINSNNSFTVNCNTAFGTSVTRTWRKNDRVISGVNGSSYTVGPSDVERGWWLYCEVMNPCGKDVAFSPILGRTLVTIRGRIPALNISDNGCNRPGITSTCADLCPIEGERVEISCSSGRGYVISGPGGISVDRSLYIRNFHPSDSGTYYCVSTYTHCSAAADSIIIGRPGVPPSISTYPPGIPTFTLPSTIMNATIPIGFAICLLEHQFVTIDCSTQSGTEPIKFTWTAASTGSRVIASEMRITVNNTDMYTCNASNAFGTSTASSIVEHTPAVNVTGEVEGILGNGCSGTDSRKRICAEVGLSVTIRCAVGPGDTYTITGPGESSNNAPLTLTVADNNYGDFTCTSTNPCGNITDIIRLEKADCSCSIPDVTVSIRKGGNTCGKQDITVSVINN